jgi:putative ABC transport system ATP-binding protein
MTIQKATAVLLLDGVSIVLTTCLGLLLLAFYHPFLLGFNIVLLMSMISITWLLGRGGIQTSIDESIAKYRIVHWLQDVISFPGAFKINGGEELAIEKANSLAAEYLAARESQFRVVIRQVTFAIGLQVVASTALLGLGGWLVIGGQLTLGQLVASELVVTVVVGAFAKAGKSLEKFYDLMAGIDKVGHLLDIPVDRRRGNISLDDEPASLEWTELRLQDGANSCIVPAAKLAPGHSLAVTGSNISGKTMLMEAIAGMSDPPSGVATISEMDATQAAVAGRGRLVAIAHQVEVFHASVAENIELGRAGIGQDRVREVLKAVGLWQVIHQLPNGMETLLETDGYPLSQDQCVRLMIARALAARPRLLVIDGLLDGIPTSELEVVWEEIKRIGAPSTIVVATQSPSLALHCDQTFEIT